MLRRRKCSETEEGAKVNLKEQTAEVVLEKDVPDEQLKRAIEKAGFQVIEIRRL